MTTKRDAIRILKETSVDAATVPGTNEWNEALQLAIASLAEEDSLLPGIMRIPLLLDYDMICKSIRKEGDLKKSIISMEECSELIKAVSKILRNGELTDDLKHDLTEEMADVYICLSILLLVYDISWSELQEWIWYKIERQDARDKNEQNN